MCKPKISFCEEFEPRNYLNFHINMCQLLGGKWNYKKSEITSKKGLKGKIKNVNEGPEQMALWVESLPCEPEYMSSIPVPV